MLSEYINNYCYESPSCVALSLFLSSSGLFIYFITCAIVGLYLKKWKICLKENFWFILSYSLTTILIFSLPTKSLLQYLLNSFQTFISYFLILTQIIKMTSGRGVFQCDINFVGNFWKYSHGSVLFISLPVQAFSEETVFDFVQKSFFIIIIVIIYFVVKSQLGKLIDFLIDKENNIEISFKILIKNLNVSDLIQIYNRAQKAIFILFSLFAMNSTLSMMMLVVRANSIFLSIFYIKLFLNTVFVHMVFFNFLALSLSLEGEKKEASPSQVEISEVKNYNDTQVEISEVKNDSDSDSEDEYYKN